MEKEFVSDRAFSVSRSKSKSIVVDEQSSAETGDKSEPGSKRVKMRDLESVFRSGEKIEGNPYFLQVGKEKSKVSEDTGTTNSDVAQAEITGEDKLASPVDPALRPIDLNVTVCLANNSAVGDTPAFANRLSSFGKHGTEQDVGFSTSRGFGWDLHAEDASSSLNKDPFYPYKNHKFLKSSDASECGSTTGPLEEIDSMRVWKEMKQNGFLSSSHRGIPVPKPRGRKNRSDGLKKKMELAKKEQEDKFAKIAAPSGLLNELNPGIISHVRNTKQVHSIIEAIVKCGKPEHERAGCKQAIPTRSGTEEINERKKHPENANDLGVNQLGLSCEEGSLSKSWSQQNGDCRMMSSESVYLNSDLTERNNDSSKLKRRIDGKTTCLSHPNQDSKGDILELKLSSSTFMASKNTSSLSNEESENLTSVSSLCVKAANVASRWLELLYEDIKVRLAALRHSKNRVQTVIHTELPYLMQREFSSNQENDPCAVKISAAGCSNNANIDVHQARWNALFDQMDKALSEEEKQLECWLNQVKEMQLHCEWGLQPFRCNALHGSQRMGKLENDSGLEEANSSERELAVMAAAASIYSTSNFLLSRLNLPAL